MDGFDARHLVGWSIFGMAIIGLAGAVAINRVMVVSIEATKLRQTRTAQAISTIHKRTNTWPKNDKDAMVNEDDRTRLKAVNATFRLHHVEANAHRALYIVNFGDHAFRLNVPERM